MISSVNVTGKSHIDDAFEQMLASSLDSVEPNPAFVRQLKLRLTQKPEVEMERTQWMTAYVMVGVGLFSGALLFWVINQLFRGVRAMIWK